ncbi:6448_t:CDS:2, partial [Entrophospora sp. SA101]
KHISRKNYQPQNSQRKSLNQSNTTGIITYTYARIQPPPQPNEMEPVRALAFETGILEQINKLGINLNERVVDDTYNTNDMGFELFVLHAEIRIILDQI